MPSYCQVNSYIPVSFMYIDKNVNRALTRQDDQPWSYTFCDVTYEEKIPQTYD